jgi:hypothetical protein
LAVDALYIFCINFDVAAPTRLGDIGSIDGRDRIGVSAHGVHRVAVLAVGGVGVSAFGRLPVGTLFVFFWALAHRRAHNVPLIVALQTVNLLRASLMWDSRHVGMTIHTEFVSVHRAFELLIIYIERLELSWGDFALQFRISVAF